MERPIRNGVVRSHALAGDVFVGNIDFLVVVKLGLLSEAVKSTHHGLQALRDCRHFAAAFAGRRDGDGRLR